MNLGVFLLALQVARPCRDQVMTDPASDFAKASDRGVGILIFAADSVPPGGTIRKTVTLYASPSTQARVLGRFVFTSADMNWSYQMELQEAGVCSNALEYGYEDDGLPIDTVRADRWVRVIYAIAADKQPRRAWVQALPGRTAVLEWPQHLKEQSLFFLDEASGIAFYHAAAGTRARFELAKDPETGRISYSITPVQVQGPWMQVRVTTPTDQCTDRAPAARDTTLWIRYLDERRRPLVWYYTRGC
jgi:hypothetical protein